MTLESWAIRDVIVTPEIARLLAFEATAGGNGVAGIGDFQIQAQPAPNGTVLARPGAGAALSRFAGAQYQSYLFRDINPATIPIAPTGSSGGRTDYLGIQILDDQYSGSTQGVQWTTLTYDPRKTPPPFPFVLCGIITQPANNTVITQSMIQTGAGVREMANPRSQPMVLAWNGRADGNTDIRKYELKTTNGATQYWPDYGVSDTYFKWEVPSWAGQLNLQYTFGNIFNNRYDCWGYAGVRMVLVSDASKWLNLPQIDWDTTVDSPGDWSRDTWTGAGRIAIPSWARGQTVSFRPIAAKVGGSQDKAKIYLGAGASISMNGLYMESAIDEIL